MLPSDPSKQLLFHKCFNLLVKIFTLLSNFTSTDNFNFGTAGHVFGKSYWEENATNGFFSSDCMERWVPCIKFFCPSWQTSGCPDFGEFTTDGQLISKDQFLTNKSKMGMLRQSPLSTAHENL